MLEPEKVYEGFIINYVLWDCFDISVAYFTRLSVWRWYGVKLQDDW
jgi:hypothetical protein